jgi:hypothetical protein
MASTRNKNTNGNFELENRANLGQMFYNIDQGCGIPYKSYFADQLHTRGDFLLLNRDNDIHSSYVQYHGYCIPYKSFHPGDGLLGAKTAREVMAFNACDIESKLFGIGSTNLVKPLPEIQPKFNDVDANLRELQSLSIIDRVELVMPEPLNISNTERYMF